MKKVFKILIAAAFLIFALAGLSACSFLKLSDDDDDGECRHPVNQNAYEYDEYSHWHPVTCEHKDLPHGSALPHKIDAWGKCYCGYGVECRATFGGDGVDEEFTQTVRAGEPLTEPPEPERAGFEFDGWYYETTSGKWAKWDFDESNAFGRSMQFKAFWTKLWTFTYELDGGTMPQGTDSVQIYRDGEKIADPVTPAREKYEFKGWSSKPDTLVEYNFKFNTAVKDVTVYAIWEELYYVDYYLNDGSGDMERTIVHYSDRVALRGSDVSQLQRDGYDHLGWSTVESATAAGTADGYNSIYVNADVQLYAVWIPAHKITYYGADGVVLKDSGLGYYQRLDSYSYLVHQGDTPLYFNASRAGYTFLNWTADTSTNEPFDFDKELEKDTTLYAVWTYYTLTLKIADGYERMGVIFKSYDDTKVTAGASVNARITQNGILGYTFDGWYGEDGQVVSEDTSYYFDMPEQSITLTARWRVKSEMSNFEFTSDSKSLMITSVKDKTVTDIYVPGYVTDIADGAFYGCNSVESMTLPVTGQRNESGEYGSLHKAFSTMTGLGFPETLTTITFTGNKLSAWAFSYLETLTSITFTQNLTEIPAGAFNDCWKLKSITLPDSVTSIGEQAFYNSGLTSIELPANLETLGDKAFDMCRIKDITIPANIKKIGANCFYRNHLENFTFKKGSVWYLTYKGETVKTYYYSDRNFVSDYLEYSHCTWEVG